MKEVIIMRGAPGAGKTTLTTLVKRLGGTGMVVSVSADKYFEGKEFDPMKLGLAHAECRDAFQDAIQSEVPVVIVDNTNTSADEMLYYEQEGSKRGYRIHHMVVENRGRRHSVHGVQNGTVNKMAERLKGSLVL